MSKKKEAEIRKAFAAFVKVARHVRNYPHPALTIEIIRSEAVEAENLAQEIFGVDEYEKIEKIAFKQPNP